MGRTVQRVSTVLGALRLAEVVRYDTDGKRNRYRLKHPAKSVVSSPRCPALSRLRQRQAVSERTTCTFPCFWNSGNLEALHRVNDS